MPPTPRKRTPKRAAAPKAAPAAAQLDPAILARAQLSQRAGRARLAIPADDRAAFVEAVRKAASFDALPARWKRAIQAAERKQGGDA